MGKAQDSIQTHSEAEKTEVCLNLSWVQTNPEHKHPPLQALEQPLVWEESPAVVLSQQCNEQLEHICTAPASTEGSSAHPSLSACDT